MQTTIVKGRDLRRGHVIIDYAGDRHYVTDVGPCDAETLSVTVKTEVELRDGRISVLGPANGFVIREYDGTPSGVMRLGTRDGLPHRDHGVPCRRCRSGWRGLMAPYFVVLLGGGPVMALVVVTALHAAIDSPRLHPAVRVAFVAVAAAFLLAYAVAIVLVPVPGGGG